MRGTLLLSHCFLTPPRVLHFMNAVNLLLLTRIQNPEDMSLLYQALSGRSDAKTISPHEAASLRALTDFLSREAAPDLISLLDGFFFSYVIEHIGKEFDLLKISADGECVLNVELKSENIGEERIKKQLGGNCLLYRKTVYYIHTVHYGVFVLGFHFAHDDLKLFRSL